jgi:sec-independent protein translocase protein TatA
MMGWTLGPSEIFVILVLLLLLFGAKRLPELGRSIGQGMREFRKSMREISTDLEDDDSKSSPKSS